MGTDELTSYYRKTDTDKYSGYGIGRIKLGIAPQKIENAIQQLIKFINYDNQSLIVKAVATLYDLYYIRPFENYSEEIAILMLKKVLALNDVNAVAALLCFETLFENKDEFESKIGDCQKYCDLTYLITYVLDKVEPLINKIDDEIIESQNLTIKKELYQADEPRVNVVKEPIFAEKPQTVEIPVVNEIQKEPLTQSEISAPINKGFKTEAIETLENLQIQNEEKKEEKPLEQGRTSEEVKAYQELVKPVQPTINGSEKLSFSQNIAISNVPTGLTEEEATKLETHLMEMNPNLSHGQAYFYARHCTIGMKYTVDQYKKCVGCAYETARSSMNNLVVLGYYKKEILKKKFVYIPVKRN